jgi:uncharacterized phage protein gp47/JayE
VNAGADGNDLTGPVSLITALSFVNSVELTGPTTSGVDEEDEDDYLNRLAEELQLMSPRPIVPHDFEVLARKNPAVSRAVAIDGWNTPPDTLGSERMIGLSAIDAAGEPVVTAVKNELVAYLESLTEVNFVVGVRNPEYTVVDVTVTVRAAPGFSTAQLQIAIESQLAAFFSPSNWGAPLFSSDPNQWSNQTVVRLSDLTHAIMQVEGVSYIESGPNIGLAGGAQTSADHNLTGTVALTRPGVMAVTVNA